MSDLVLACSVTELLLLCEDLPLIGDVIPPLTGDLTVGDDLMTLGDCLVTRLVLLEVLADDTLRRLSDGTGDVG